MNHIQGQWVFPTWQCLQGCELWAMMYVMLYKLNLHRLDISGISEKFNVYVTLAIIPRTKNIKRAFWLVHILIKTLSSSLLGRRLSLLHHVYWKNLALLQYHKYSGSIYFYRWWPYPSLIWVQQSGNQNLRGIKLTLWDKFCTATGWESLK